MSLSPPHYNIDYGKPKIVMVDGLKVVVVVVVAVPKKPGATVVPKKTELTGTPSHIAQ